MGMFDFDQRGSSVDGLKERFLKGDKGERLVIKETESNFGIPRRDSPRRSAFRKRKKRSKIIKSLVELVMKLQ